MINDYVSVYRAKERRKYSERILEKIAEIKDEEESIFKRIQDSIETFNENGSDEDVTQRKFCLDLVERAKFAIEELKNLNKNYKDGLQSKRLNKYLNVKKINIADYVIKNDFFNKTEIEDLEGCWSMLKKYSSGEDRGTIENYINPYGDNDKEYEADNTNVDYNDYKKVSVESDFHKLNLSNLFEVNVNLKNNAYAQLLALKNLSNEDYKLAMGNKYIPFLQYLENSNSITFKTANEFVVSGFVTAGSLPTGFWGGDVDRDYFIVLNSNNEPEIIFIEEFSVGVSVVSNGYGSSSVVTETVPTGYNADQVKFKYTIKCRSENRFSLNKNLSAVNKKNKAFEKYKNNILNCLNKGNEIIKRIYDNGITPEYDNGMLIDRPETNYKNFYNELKGTTSLNVNLLNRIGDFFVARKLSLFDYFLYGTYEDEDGDGKDELIPSDFSEELNTYLRNRMDKTDGTLLTWYGSVCSMDNSYSSLEDSIKEGSMIFKKLLVWEITIDRDDENSIYLYNKDNDFRSDLNKCYKKVGMDIRKDEELKVGDVVFLMDNNSENPEVMTTIKSIENINLELTDSPEINISTKQDDFNNIEISSNSTTKVKKITFNNTINFNYSTEDGFRLIKERRKS